MYSLFVFISVLNTKCFGFSLFLKITDSGWSLAQTPDSLTTYSPALPSSATLLKKLLHKIPTIFYISKL